MAGSGFGDQLLSARKRKGLSKAELARRVGVTWRQLHAWESDEYRPSMLRALALARELDVNIQEWSDLLASGEPPYAGWTEFRKTPEGQALTDAELRFMTTLFIPPGHEPDRTWYRMQLQLLRGLPIAT